MNADLSGLVAVLGGLGALTGLVVFFVTRWDKKRDPVSKAEAEIALAAKTIGLVSGVNDRLIREVGRLDDKIAAIEERHARERDEDRTKISSLERQVEAMMRDRDDIVRYFIKERAWTAAERCDVMLLVGTSGTVWPAAELPHP